MQEHAPGVWPQAQELQAAAGEEREHTSPVRGSYCTGPRLQELAASGGWGMQSFTGNKFL